MQLCASIQMAYWTIHASLVCTTDCQINGFKVFQVCIYELHVYELFIAMTTKRYTTRIVQHTTIGLPLPGRPGRFYQRASTCRQSLPWPNPNSHHWAEDALFLGNYFARALPCQRDSEAHKIRGSDVISIEWQTNNVDWQNKIYFCIIVKLHILEVTWCTYVICGECTCTVWIHVVQFMTSTAATRRCASKQNRQYVKQYMYINSKMKLTMFSREYRNWLPTYVITKKNL